VLRCTIVNLACRGLPSTALSSRGCPLDAIHRSSRATFSLEFKKETSARGVRPFLSCCRRLVPLHMCVLRICKGFSDLALQAMSSGIISLSPSLGPVLSLMKWCHSTGPTAARRGCALKGCCVAAQSHYSTNLSRRKLPRGK